MLMWLTSMFPDTHNRVHSPLGQGNKSYHASLAVLISKGTGVFHIQYIQPFFLLPQYIRLSVDLDNIGVSIILNLMCLASLWVGVHAMILHGIQST